MVPNQTSQNQSDNQNQDLEDYAEQSPDNPGLIGDNKDASDLDPNQGKAVFVIAENEDSTGDMPVQTPQHQDMAGMVGHAPEPDDADDIDETGRKVGIYAEPGEDRQPLNVAEEVQEAEEAARDQQPQ